MKKILTAKYRYFVLYLEIFLFIVLIPLTYNFVPVNEGTRTFYIPSSDIDTVVATLKTNGYEVTWFDKIMLKFRKVPTEGWYSVEPREHGRILFFQHLYKQKTDETMDVVVYAGETKNELTTRLANDMKLEQKKLLSTYHTLEYFQEADILSQRYTVARKADEDTTMKYLFLMSGREIEKFYKEYFSKTPSILELKIVYIIASIIQKESNSVEEMPLISSVVYNRLEKNMRLQMDGTLNYGEFSHTLVTPERIKNDKSAYNTYKRKGLPPHPLSTVTLDALKASVKPAQSDYLFFMLNQNGTHDFSAEYTKHLANIRSFRTYQKEKRMKEDEKLKEMKEDEEFKEMKRDEEFKEMKKFYIEPHVEKLPYEDLGIGIDWEKVKI